MLSIHVPQLTQEQLRELCACVKRRAECRDPPIRRNVRAEKKRMQLRAAGERRDRSTSTLLDPRLALVSAVSAASESQCWWRSRLSQARRSVTRLGMQSSSTYRV